MTSLHKKPQPSLEALAELQALKYREIDLSDAPEELDWSGDRVIPKYLQNYVDNQKDKPQCDTKQVV